MQMKKVSKSRWTILALAVVGLIVLFNVAGCAMLEAQLDKAKGLVGIGNDSIVIETPTCEGETCEDIRG